MAGWLSRTTSLFKQPLPAPEPFEVECDCGGKLVGQRAPTYQRPTCPVCDRPVFVLPANVYPRQKPKSPPKNIPTKPTDPGKTARPSSNSVVDDRPPQIPLKVARGKTSIAGRDVSSPPEPEPALLREPRRPIFTPLRLVTVAILCVSALTARGLWSRHLIETAKKTVAVAADAGTAAVRELDFATGAKELERARLAVDLLGRKDQTAEEIRRLSREATVLANLASSSLTEVLQDTLSNAKPGQTEPLRMASLDKNAWVIFDTGLIPNGEGPNRFLVDAPMVLGKISVQIEIESATLARVAVSSDGTESPRIIFAAQLEEISSPAGEPLTSVLKLNGKTAILWTSYDTYGAVGYRPFDTESEKQTKAILERQLENR
jgi:hypothetical protein